MSQNDRNFDENDEFDDMNPIMAATEQDPLLPKSAGSSNTKQEPWVKPQWFLWIEIAIFANVFLSGFDGTVTASTYALISSEFRSSNLASWITTAYLVTSTALQPLYGRFSDIFGRRVCLMIATTLFGLGCLGCAFSPDLVTLIIMRGITGVGGGGLMTMGEYCPRSPARNSRLNIDSNYHQLRLNPTKTKGNVSSSTKRLAWLGVHYWGHSRRCRF